MKVLLDPVHAAPTFRRLPPAVKRRLKNALKMLVADPTGGSNRLDIKRLDADPGPAMYRFRVGDWRLPFTIDAAVVVLRIFHRRDGYGWLTDMP